MKAWILLPTSIILSIIVIDNSLLIGQASNSTKVVPPKTSEDFTNQDRVLIKLTPSGTTAQADVSPKNIKVKVGTTVVWENMLPEKIYVQSKPDENHYEGELLNGTYFFPGESREEKLNKIGNFIYDGSNGFGSYYVRGTINVVQEATEEKKIPTETIGNRSANYDASNDSSLSNSIEMENQSNQLRQASPTETVGWQTYEDGDNHYKIQYPQGWRAEEPKSPLSGYYPEDSPMMKRFREMHIDIKSEDDPGTSVSVEVKNASRTLDPATLKVKSLPLEHFANELIRGLTTVKSEPTVIRNEAITFNGDPAWRVDYIWNFMGIQGLYNIHIFVIKDSKLYEIDFTTPPLKVEETRTVGEKIIQTFQFTNNTTP